MPDEMQRGVLSPEGVTHRHCTDNEGVDRNRTARALAVAGIIGRQLKAARRNLAGGRHMARCDCCIDPESPSSFGTEQATVCCERTP